MWVSESDLTFYLARKILAKKLYDKNKDARHLASLDEPHVKRAVLDSSYSQIKHVYIYITNISVDRSLTFSLVSLPSYFFQPALKTSLSLILPQLQPLPP